MFKTRILPLRAALEGALIACLLTAVLSLSSAQARPGDEQTEPADGAVVASVSAVRMRFRTPTQITLVRLAGEHGDVPLTSMSGTDPVKEYVAAPEGRLPAGRYTVDWRGLAADGDVTQGDFSFTVTE